MKKFLLIIGFFLFFALPFSSQALTEVNLSGTERFSINNPLDSSGYSVAFADLDGDNYDDLIIGANNEDAIPNNSGAVYIFYGSAALFSGPIDLTAANAKFTGVASGDQAGYAIANAGDVDGDSKEDILVGAPFNNYTEMISDSGSAYLIYGSASRYSGTINLNSYGSSYTGAEFNIDQNTVLLGSSVASAGDVDNNGYSDIIIGSPQGGGDNKGVAYLLYGSATRYSGSNGLQACEASICGLFTGESNNDKAGTAISSAGDIDGDGFDDLLISATGYDSYKGAVYLYYGQTTQLIGSHALSNADAIFKGEASSDLLGSSIASANDVDNDGYSDILMGASSYDNGAYIGAGATYLLYGSGTRFAGGINVSTIGSTIFGAKFTIAESGASSGATVAGLGNMDDDSLGDFIIGAYQSDSTKGSAYLISGTYSTSRYSGIVNLTDATVKFNGENVSDNAGFALAAAGDVNHDGNNDVLIGAPSYDDGAFTSAGAAYLGYVYIDNDLDGYAGTSGLLSGTDCNDNDATIYAAVSYYQDADGDGYGNDAVKQDFCSLTAPTGYAANNYDCDDSNLNIYAPVIYYRDADSDTLGDPNVSIEVCSLTPPDGYVANKEDPDDTTPSNNEINPPEEYQNLDPADEEVAAASILSVTGAKKGKIKVFYTNGQIYKYTIFQKLSTKKKTKVKQYRNTAYYLVLQPFGKKVALVNVLDGSVLDSKVLSKTEKYKTNSLKLFKLRKKYFATITSKGKNKGQLGIVRVKINKTKLGLKSVVSPLKFNYKPTKTNKKNNFVQLRNKNNKVIERYLVNNQFKLILSS